MSLPSGLTCEVEVIKTPNNLSCESYADRGIQGKSAYEQAVEGGYTGTEAEFEAALASDIATVAGSISNVNTVGNDISNVNAVAGNKTNIDTVAGISSNVTTVANNTSNINTAVANLPAINAAPTYASNAQKWAEGTDSDVTPLGGTHSSKGWANVAQTAAQQVSNKASTDLDNLTSIGKNISNWSTNATDCLVEVPQNVKLTLSSGTLTFQAGSKVYIPNGWVDGTYRKFDEVTIASDLTRTDTSSVTKAFLFYVLEENRIVPYANVFVGDTAPTFTGQGIWYDTTNNLAKRSVNGGSTWDNVKASLPLGRVTNDGTGYTSIDETFNGMGYMVNIVFVLTGVKGLIANGRNDDGTLKSSAFERTRPAIITIGAVTLTSRPFATNAGYNTIVYNEQYYNEDENIVHGNSPTGSQYFATTFAYVTTNASGNVISFNPCKPYHAVDYRKVERILGKQVGEVYYSQSSSAADNRGALPLFTGETISSADTLYPDFYTWVNTHSELQISAANYEAALSTYGECPKYVIDTVNKTIRLPKLVNYIKNANTTDGIAQASAGLPNITGEFNAQQNNYGGWAGMASGAFQYGSSYTGKLNYNEGATSEGFSFDASNSNDIYGNSNTVTPAHTTLYPWVCAYNAVVPASTAQAAQFQDALSGKADTNLGNLSDAGKIVAANASMPSVTSDSLTFSHGGSYTAPADGYFLMVGYNTTSALNRIAGLRNDTTGLGCVGIPPNESTSKGRWFVPVKKGEVVYAFNYAGSVDSLLFIYAQGSISEAN